MSDLSQKEMQVFAHRDQLGIIDVVVDVEGRRVGKYTGQTLEEMKPNYPDIVLSSMDEYLTRHDAQIRTAPVEITVEQFDEALNVLPPMRWERRGTSESFKMSKFLSGDITSIYARQGERYFKLADHYRMKHEAIMEKVHATFPDALQAVNLRDAEV